MSNLSKQEIIDKIKQENFNFAWINTYSDLKLIDLEAEKNIDKYFEDLIEAKYFNEENEISVMEAEEEVFSVYEFKNTGSKTDYTDYIEEKQILTKHKSPYGGENDKLVIRHYLEYDEEGQAYVDYTKLCNVERG